MTANFRQRRLVLLAISAVLFAVVFGIMLLVDDLVEAPGLLLVVPIALLALGLGPAAGLAAAVVAFGLFALSVEVADQEVGPVGYLTRAVALGICGPVLGMVTSQLRAKESQTRSILETSHEAFIAMSRDGLITDWNSAAEAIFGWRKSDVLGRRLGDTIIPPSLRVAHEAGLRRYLESGDARSLDKLLNLSALHRDGHEFPMELSITAVNEGPNVSFCAFLRDVTEREQAEHERARLLAKVEALARTDELTGLPNRRSWEDQLRREIARARRSDDPLSLAILDLDCFKDYNDQHGHQAGDRLLIEAGAAWRMALREGDLIARYGGEEFAVVLPDCPPREAAVVVERLRAAVPDGASCTAGVATLDRAETAESLVNRADTALYEGKRAGRNRTVISEA
ncbi:MAG: sensor domain-containing diguanylate cyclase [Actinomycetota bacterium]|nr:sensor domain-containing diguanylate cyclase [Actinomycetota bacterium]